MKSVSTFNAALICLCISPTAQAFNYHELSVYGHQTEGQGVIEIENMTSLSNGSKSEYGTDILRSSFEINYGLLDWLDAAIYSDFVKVNNDNGEDKTKYAGSRFRLHGQIFEKGEKNIDLGAYVEIGIPHDSDEVYEIEIKPILEKDWGRFTFVANPILEYEVEEESKTDSDGFEETERESKFKSAYAFAFKYRKNESILPSLNFFGDFAKPEEQIQIVQPQIDFKVDQWSIAMGLGFGLTEASEKRLFNAKLEVEI